MNSDLSAPAAPAEPGSAGAMLRAARERQGLHIAALAAAIKVTPAKLDALENDRYAELPDATFTRALAQSVCRVLKIDARPVLDKLPSSIVAGLEKVDSGLNTPFRDRPSGIDPGEWAIWHQPVFWVVLALLAAAAAFWLLPRDSLTLPSFSVDRMFGGAPQASAPAVAAPAINPAPPAIDTAVPAVPPVAAAGTQVAPVVVETVHSAPATDPAAAAAEMPHALVTLRTDEDSWVEVHDARNLVLFSRTLQSGETVGLDGNLPIKLKVGNAAATRVTFRGQPVDLKPMTRDNVARIELK